jgi:hypothetical protein
MKLLQANWTKLKMEIFSFAMYGHFHGTKKARSDQHHIHSEGQETGTNLSGQNLFFIYLKKITS